MLAGCGSPNQPTLKVRLLKNSVPVQILNQFRKQLQQAADLDFAPTAQLKDFFVNLQNWKQKPPAQENGGLISGLFGNSNTKTTVPDLVTLGDYWLAQAIAQQLIQPLNPQELEGWETLPARWQTLVRRNAAGQLDREGQVWGAPYRWGSTVIAYRTDKVKLLGWIPQDWSDLWRSEVRDRISLLDSPREVIGLTLKKLGQSYNTEELDKVPQLEAELKALHQQVRFYSSDTYLQPLILGDTWMAVGWSTEILRLMQSNHQIKAIVPQSGTALWTDLWVRPGESANPTEPDTQTLSPLTQQWINFCWQPEIAIQLSLLSKAASPTIVGMNAEKLPQALQTNSLLLPPTEVIDKSEFLSPLSPDTAKQYLDLWRKIRLS